MRSISSVGVGALRTAVTMMIFATGFRSESGNASMVTAIVPPKTMIIDGMWMKTATPPGPIDIAPRTRMNARTTPMTVLKSIWGAGKRSQRLLLSTGR